MSATAPTTLSGTWVSDPVHSNASFAIKHMIVSTFRANFAQVEAAGCLTEGPNQSWMLTNATEPVAARAGAFGASASNVTLGSQTFRLVSVGAFRSQLKPGYAVQVKGLIRKDPEMTLINLTAVSPTGSPCKN